MACRQVDEFDSLVFEVGFSFRSDALKQIKWNGGKQAKA